MASSLSNVGLTKTRELGKYNVTPGSGGGRPQQEERRVTARDLEMTRECAGCGKFIKKGKVLVACDCKLVVHCSKECAQSSTHICYRLENYKVMSNKKAAAVINSCFQRCHADLEANRAPSSEKIEKMMKRAKGDPETLLAIAEAGDPFAAFVMGSGFGMLRKKQEKDAFETNERHEKDALETDEIVVKWLKMAAEGGVPEGMLYLSIKLMDCTLQNENVIDKRLAHFWMVEAYKTGKMDYLIDALEVGGMGLTKEFEILHSFDTDRENQNLIIQGPTLSHLLLATRWMELKEWGGKTAMGEPFYGRAHFNAFSEEVGGLKKFPKLQQLACAAESESQKKNLGFFFISGRHGSADIASKFLKKERNENNIKFLQGVKADANPDFQLIIESKLNYLMTLPTTPAPGRTFSTPIPGRTAYLVSCKHNATSLGRTHKMEGTPGSMVLTGEEGSTDLSKFDLAGGCLPCYREAFQRLRAVSQGQYSISLTEIIPNYGYAARYVTVDGVIVQDVFKVYSKPDIRQVLQCLASNPADLHPLAVAEDQNLYWNIIWFWGSVFSAILDTCNQVTLKAVYQRLGPKIVFDGGEDVSAMAAFPEAAAGEWRIACGSEQCPKVDHKVKFNLCKGCKIRRYCNEACQRIDWPKHKLFCRAAKKGGF